MKKFCINANQKKILKEWKLEKNKEIKIKKCDRNEKSKNIKMKMKKKYWKDSWIKEDWSNEDLKKTHENLSECWKIINHLKKF